MCDTRTVLPRSGSLPAHMRRARSCSSCLGGKSETAAHDPGSIAASRALARSLALTQILFIAPLSSVARLILSVCRAPSPAPPPPAARPFTSLGFAGLQYRLVLRTPQQTTEVPRAEVPHARTYTIRAPLSLHTASPQPSPLTRASHGSGEPAAKIESRDAPSHMRKQHVIIIHHCHGNKRNKNEKQNQMKMRT